MKVFLHISFFALYFSLSAKAQSDHSANGPSLEAGANNGIVTKLITNINASDQSGCMKGERFSQTIKGKTHTRTVSKMPSGYFYGMILNFAKNKCKASATAHSANSFVGRVSGPSTQDKDALRRYAGNSVLSGQDALIQNYALMLPLGMIESSGQFNEGRDKSASNTSSSTAEAGLFQVSYNSTNLGSPKLKRIYQELLSEYNYGKDEEKCMAGVFAQNVKLSKNSASAGGGEGRRFQDIMKTCPAFAADYMAALLRTNYRHNGPLIRKEARPRAACVNALTSVAKMIDQGGGDLCSQVSAVKSSDFNTPGLDQRMAQIRNDLNKVIDNGSYSYNPETGGMSYTYAGDEGPVTEDYTVADDSSSTTEQDEEVEAANADLYNDLQKQAQKLEAEADKLEKEGKTEEAEELRAKALEIRGQMSNAALIEAQLKRLERHIGSEETNLEQQQRDLKALQEKLQNTPRDEDKPAIENRIKDTERFD
jgi:hypothetical protein